MLPRKPPLPSPLKVIRTIHPVMKRQVRRLPFPLLRVPIESLMRGALQEAMENGELQFLRGRWLQIHIEDMKLKLNITLGARGPILVQSEVEPDVIVSGRFKQFILLADSSNDPDALFFQRKIKVEGDTEMGLLVKNTLFASEKPIWIRHIVRKLDELGDVLDPSY